MGKPMKYLTVSEDEWVELEKIQARGGPFELNEWMIIVLERNIEVSQTIGRARQLQQSQLLAAASFSTSKKTKLQIH